MTYDTNKFDINLNTVYIKNRKKKKENILDEKYNFTTQI